MSKEGNRSPQTDFPRSAVCLFPFPTVGYPPGRAAQQRSQRVHDDVVHLTSSQTVTVLQKFNSRRRKARQHDRDGDGQLPFPQHERQGQPDGEKQQNIHQHRPVQFRLLSGLPEVLKWNKHSFRRFFPSCADRHIEDHRRDPGKNGRVEYPPPPAALFPRYPHSTAARIMKIMILCSGCI